MSRNLGWPADMLLLLCLAAALRLPAIGLSELSWDETSFVLVAREIVAGHWPYTTVFDHKPIGLYLHFAAALALFGDHVLASRLLGIAVTTAAAACVRLICVRRLGLSRRAGNFLACCYLIATIGFDGQAVFSEHFVNLYVLLSAFLLPDRRRARTLLSGAAAGIAVSVNYLALPVLAGMIAGYLAGVLRSNGSDRASRAGWFVAGAAASTALTLLPIVIFSDVASYFTLQWRFLSRYSSPAPLPLKIKHLAQTGAPLIPLLAVAMVLAQGRSDEEGKGSVGRAASQPLLFAGMTGGAFVAVLASGYVYAHYLLLTVPPLILLAAALGARAAPEIRKVAFAVVGGTALMVGINGFLEAAVGARIVAAAMLHGRDEDLPRQLAAKARERAGPAETVYSFCAPLVVYQLLHTRPPTRFPFMMQSMNPQYASALGISIDGEIASVLERRPVVIFGDYGNCFGIPRSSWEKMRDAMQRGGYARFADLDGYSFYAPSAAVAATR